jgi:hypothetical protein
MPTKPSKENRKRQDEKRKQERAAKKQEAQRLAAEMSKSRGAGRTRNFVAVVYPESAPNNWQTILAEHLIPAFVSPLHEHDVNPDGELKKAHWHVMIMFEGVKTNEQAKAIFDTIGGVGSQRVNDYRAYARYLCHLDNPEKVQYPRDAVQCLSGADYIASIGLSTDKYKAIAEMQFWCTENECISLSELKDYASIHRSDWFRVLCDSSSAYMDRYLKSKDWTETKRRSK